MPCRVGLFCLESSAKKNRKGHMCQVMSPIPAFLAAISATFLQQKSSMRRSSP